MTQAYTGMRKGISLVEMVIAIILFATLATITMKYSKQYLDTDLQAKKARVAVLTEQGNTLIQAAQIYKIDTGLAATNINDLNGTGGILTEVPLNITEIGGATGNWKITASLVTAHPQVFDYLIVAGPAGSLKNDEQYCALFNHEFNSSIELNVTDTQEFGDSAAKTIAGAYAYYGKNAFCYSTGPQAHHIIVLQD